MELLLIFLIFFLAVVLVGLPLMQPAVNIPVGRRDQLEALETEKLSLYQQIKELDMERDVGNLSPEDYNYYRRELKQEVSAIIRQIKTVSFSR